jgi:hypothetical protein
MDVKILKAKIQDVNIFLLVKCDHRLPVYALTDVVWNLGKVIDDFATNSHPHFLAV